MRLRELFYKVVEESGPGVTTTSNMGTVDAPHLSPGKARGKTSYLGTPGGPGGTKAPPQPKVKQKKNPDGTFVPAHELKNSKFFSEQDIIKR